MKITLKIVAETALGQRAGAKDALSAAYQTPSIIIASRKYLLRNSTMADPQSVLFSEEGPFKRAHGNTSKTSHQCRQNLSQHNQEFPPHTSEGSHCETSGVENVLRGGLENSAIPSPRRTV